MLPRYHPDDPLDDLHFKKGVALCKTLDGAPYRPVFLVGFDPIMSNLNFTSEYICKAVVIAFKRGATHVSRTDLNFFQCLTAR